MKLVQLKVCLFAGVLFFVIGCSPIKEKSLQEINADMDAKLKIQNEYFLNLKAGEFVQLNRILSNLARLNGKKVLTRGVLLVTAEKTVVSDSECPVGAGAPQLRELFVQKNDAIKEMPISGSYVEISGDISSERTGLHGMWPGSINIKEINMAKASDGDCSPL
jgi:hypothetical protein